MIDLGALANGDFGNGVGEVADRASHFGCHVGLEDGQAGVAAGDNQGSGIGYRIRALAQVDDVEEDCLRVVVRQPDVGAIAEEGGVQGDESIIGNGGVAGQVVAGQLGVPVGGGQGLSQRTGHPIGRLGS